MRLRRLSFLLIWTSFYEQLAWTPILVLLATAAGDPQAVAPAASAYSLANFGGNLLFGHLADRFSRHRVAGAGLVAMAATAWVHLLSSSPAMLVGVRFLHGLAAAAIAPAALASVTAGTPAGRRGETMARVGLVIAISSMISPPLTGRLATHLGLSMAVGLLAGGLALVGLVSLLLGGALPRAAVPAKPMAAPPRSMDPVLTLVAGCVAFALMFGQNVLFYAFPLKARGLGFSAASIGGLLGAFAVGSVLAFVPPLSRASDRWGRGRPLLAGLAIAAGALLGLAFGDQSWQMAVSLLTYGLGFGLVFPAVSALSADAAGQQRQGLTFGVLTAAFSAGAVAGPWVSQSLASVAPPFAVAAVVAGLGAGVVLLWQLWAPAAQEAPRITG